MTALTWAALAATLLGFIGIGLYARAPSAGVDDYVTARNSQGALALGLSFLASGMGGWILFAPPEVGVGLGWIAVAGYAAGSALPFVVFALFGARLRRLMPQGRSIAEFMRLRFGAGMERWVLTLSVLYMLCFVTAELTAAGAIVSMLTDVDGRVVIVGVALATLVYTAWGGLRASMLTDRWQAWLLLALLAIVSFAVTPLLQRPGLSWQLPSAPAANPWAVALTLLIAVTASNLFHQGYWQRMWSARSGQALRAGAAVGAAATLLMVLLVGGFGVLAAAAGLDVGSPPLPFFALLHALPAWLVLPAVLLGVTLVASSVDTLENALASLAVAQRPTLSLASARWLTVLLMIPAILVALQGYSVLRLFLIADLLCATAVVPLLMGLSPRTTRAAALASAGAGVAGAFLPTWLSTGSLAAALHAASFPGAVPTLAPFAGALAASAVVGAVITALSREPRGPDLARAAD